jgi:hypothetical protein
VVESDKDEGHQSNRAGQSGKWALSVTRAHGHKRRGCRGWAIVCA